MTESWTATTTVGRPCGGAGIEQEQDYDQALQCYEHVLLARSHYLGQYHIDVKSGADRSGHGIEALEGSLTCTA
jgi:hypothetical protein